MKSINNFTQDSAKILTEKLALSRELALLKPEVEHLRSQLSHQKDVVAEKLALERQLNALEVELANEKRAAQKAASRQSRDTDAEEDLHNQIRELEKQLSKEKRAAQKAMQSQESKGTASEEELEELREKLAETEKMLASEKKAATKAAKTSNAAVADSADELEQLREELAEAKATIAKDKKEKEQLRKEFEKALGEAEGRRLPLEERIDNLKAKLRETREELKQCRADLQQAQEQAAKKASTKAMIGKKRRVNEPSTEETILHTPSAEDRSKRLSKKIFAPTAVGEKSTFSITPFLNKTVNMSDISPKGLAEISTETTTAVSMSEPENNPSAVESAEDEPVVKIPKAVAAPAAKKPRGRPPMKALGEASISKKNMAAPKRRKVPSTESTLEKVTEEVEDENQDQENRSVEDSAGKVASPPKKQLKSLSLKTASKTEAPLASATAAVPQPEPKKKKRKLLGNVSKATTLFDEPDAEDAERPVPVASATSRAPTAAAAATSKRPPVARPVKRTVGLGGTKNAFAGAASFSPLKRDKRGVNASFLA